MLAELDVPMDFTHLDAGPDKRSWGKSHSKLEKPNVRRHPAIFMHRDPRDTVVSFFHQMIKRQPIPLGRRLRFSLLGKMPPKSIDRFVRSPGFGIEKTVVFNLQCAEYLKAYPVAYEQMVKDPVRTLSGMLTYLQRNIPQAHIQSVVERNSFQKMRKREAAGAFAEKFGNKLMPLDTEDPNSFKVRRGKVGGWCDEMEPETQEFANEVLERYRYFERMKELTQQAT